MMVVSVRAGSIDRKLGERDEPEEGMHRVTSGSRRPKNCWFD
jgi:hypothetical protein